MAEIILPCGRIALLDDADVGLITPYRLNSDVRLHTVYVRCWQRHVRKKYVYLHRLIMGVKMTDHRNGNGLDNRRENLRLCSYRQNLSNKSKNRLNPKNYKGVYRSRSGNRWRVYISVDNKNIWGGAFDDEVAAAIAYDALARKHHGEFARVNFPNE